jgi:hypothetical protein
MRALVIGLLLTPLCLAPVSLAWARGPWRANPANTPGWQLMTPQERIDHQATVRSFTDYNTCHAYLVSHRALMEERARQLNLTLGPGRDFCAHLLPAPRPNPAPD